MKRFNIVVLPGDGIGPEITDVALEVLAHLQQRTGTFQLQLETHRAGARFYRETGKNISSATLEAIEQADAAFKGPVGLPEVRTPEGNEAGVLGEVLRVGFDLYANIRPIRLWPLAPGPLKAYGPGDIDYIILRENSQGLYLSRGRGLVTPDAASDTMLLTRSGCERICRLAFQLAEKKQAGAPSDGRRRVTLVDKSNVLLSYYFFRRIFLDMAAEFPHIEAECLYVDAAAAALVSRPDHFQIVVTENMFGDILSDLGAATVGGLGMCPSANIGGRAAYFEPIHGSAPDIAGRGQANPISQILSGAMMLDHLGLEMEAGLLEKALHQALTGNRFAFNASGGIDGGSSRVAAALKEEIDRLTA